MDDEDRVSGGSRGVPADDARDHDGEVDIDAADPVERTRSTDAEVHPQVVSLNPIDSWIEAGFR